MKPQIKRIVCIFWLLSSALYSGQDRQKELLKKVDSLINSYARADAPGMAIGIIKDEKIIYKKTYGLANLEYKIPVTDSTAFDIASVSKQFTAFIILLAEKEGKLSLDDDVRTYLPELKSLPYKITIRQLASHTHGLPDFSVIKRIRGFGDEFRVTHNEAVKTMLNIKNFAFRPGDRYWYNNTGFMLLAEILQRIYKKDFNEILREYIFIPLQMNHSMAVNDPEKIVPNKAESYKENGTVFSKSPLGQMEYGSSNIFTTLDDLCKWARNFQKPLVGSRELYNEMQKNTILNSGERVEYGLGLQTAKYKGLDIVFHGGGTAGYRSYILHIPAYRFSIVLAGNRSVFDGLSITYKLVDLFFGDKQTLPPSPKKKTYTQAELKTFEGTYEINPGNYLKIFTKENKLYLENDATPLTIVGDNQFTIPFIPTGRITFQKNTAILGIGDFEFKGKKVDLNPENTDKIDLHQFTGFYRNEEFNTIYQLVIEDNKLVAMHPINPKIPLYPLNPTTFYSSKSIFGQLDFQYDKNKQIMGFKLSGANFSNLEFRKIK
ncbi:hypothetical protein OK18_16425 [Chryseobacterium gallinarum]|uniref:Beta-lactamase-related domain-containing protein n=1 Tax=Chryseobacterium gallinarum TaxID=1324352 RepID=A0A0G3M5S5_CHRGL|nr:serine hydrolase domain-containing protein [Chryseobacterium gallinarum]AKK73975.1 hypothetical protein OK18_16425 [Chryseobacterium gallinarum]